MTVPSGSSIGTPHQNSPSHSTGSFGIRRITANSLKNRFSLPEIVFISILIKKCNQYSGQTIQM